MVKLRLDQLELNHWNANEVTGDRYTQLVNDMREHGQREPVTVSPYPVFYPAEDKDPEHPYTTPETWGGFFVFCDGEHRYKAAKELGWKELEATVEELTEDQAITRFYRQQATRGTLNPLKEAALFNHEVQDSGLTEDQVAEKYNVTRQYVSGRRMLVNVAPTVRELYERPEEKARELKAESLPSKDEYVKEHTRPWNDEEEVAEQYDELVEGAKDFAPRGALTPGHMRAISSLPEKKQEEIALDIVERGLTVRDTEDWVRREKEKAETREKVTKALLSAKRKTCPKCGKLPRPDDFGYQGEDWFVCSECRHSWDYTKTQAEADAERKATQDEETRAKVAKMQQGRENPAYIKHIQPYDELLGRLAGWALTKLGGLSRVYSVKVEGMVGDRLMKLELDPQTMSAGADLSYTLAKAEAIDSPGAQGAMNITEERRFGLHMEPKQYKRSGEQTRIDLGWRANANEESREQLRVFLDDIVYTGLNPWDKVEAKEEPLEAVDEPEEEPPEDAEPATDYSAGVTVCPSCGKKVPTTPYCINCSQPLMKAQGIREQLFRNQEAPEEDPRPLGELCEGCTEDCDECPHEDQESDEDLSEDEPEEEHVEGSEDRTLEAARQAINEALGIPPVPKEEPKVKPRPGRTFYTIEVDENEEGTHARDSLGSRFGYSYSTGQGGGAGSIRDREGFKNTVERMVSEIWKVSKEMKSYPRPTMRNTVVEVCQAAADEGLITEAEIWNALLTYPIPKEAQA